MLPPFFRIPEYLQRRKQMRTELQRVNVIKRAIAFVRMSALVAVYLSHAIYRLTA